MDVGSYCRVDVTWRQAGERVLEKGQCFLLQCCDACAHVEICKQLKRKGNQRTAHNPQPKNEQQFSSKSPYSKKGVHTYFGTKASNQVDPSALSSFSSDPLEWEDLRPLTGTDNPAHAKLTPEKNNILYTLAQTHASAKETL